MSLYRGQKISLQKISLENGGANLTSVYNTKSFSNRESERQLNEIILIILSKPKFINKFYLISRECYFVPTNSNAFNTNWRGSRYIFNTFDASVLGRFRSKIVRKEGNVSFATHFLRSKI